MPRRTTFENDPENPANTKWIPTVRGRVPTNALKPGTYIGPERAKSPLPTKPPWNATRTVTVLMIFSFVLYGLDRDIFKGIDTGKTESTNDFLRRYGAWAFLFVVLIAGTDFEATKEIATAFALVIFLSILIVAPSAKSPNQSLGAKAFDNLSKLFNPADVVPGVGG